MMAFPVFHKGHGAIVRMQCGKPPKKHTEPASFSVLKGELVKASVGFCRDSIRCFMESSQTRVEQWSKLCSWHPHVSHYQTSDSWSPISDRLHFSTLGWRAEEECEEHQRLKKKALLRSVPALIRGPRRRWQVYSVKNSDATLSWGCCGQLETNRKPLEHEQRPAFRMK